MGRAGNASGGGKEGGGRTGFVPPSRAGRTRMKRMRMAVYPPPEVSFTMTAAAQGGADASAEGWGGAVLPAQAAAAVASTATRPRQPSCGERRLRGKNRAGTAAMRAVVAAGGGRAGRGGGGGQHGPGQGGRGGRRPGQHGRRRRPLPSFDGGVAAARGGRGRGSHEPTAAGGSGVNATTCRLGETGEISPPRRPLVGCHLRLTENVSRRHMRGGSLVSAAAHRN